LREAFADAWLRLAFVLHATSIQPGPALINRAVARLVMLATLCGWPSAGAAANRDTGWMFRIIRAPAGFPGGLEQMFSEGRRFAFIKGSEGLTGPDDPTMSINCARASTAGLLVGVYHFPHAENRTNASGGVMEADHFLAYAGTNIGPAVCVRCWIWKAIR